MSTPGDLGWLRAAIFYHLEHRQPLSVPLEHPQRVWLEWLGVPTSVGIEPGLQASPLGEADLTAAQVKEEGILPEVLYACLVQTEWHPHQVDWVARTRSEILACYDHQERQPSDWVLSLEVLRRINAYRLQELTPAELLEASRPLWDGDCPDTAPMEAWILLHLEGLHSLHDVTACLSPFLHPEQIQRQDQLPLPPGLQWEEAVAILGPHRLSALKEEPCAGTS